MNLRTLRLWSALALTAILGSSCTGYRIGTTLPPKLRSIAVETFKNRTGEPMVETEVTRATLQEFQREGQLTLLPAEQADILLYGTLVRYVLEPMRYERDRPQSAREYRIVLRAAIQAVERSSGKVLVDTVVERDATLPAGGDLVTARLTALPEASRRLAHEIVNAVVSAW